ncbi:MAG: succinate dehydrogenase, cytochrome b556 subunit [Nitrococcus sp.]|nr:succinate dehydrogenase, cytochrome b556 subunit [Nitrococcus sp.]
MDNDGRPLAPHLQIYRFPITAISSITHRITGALLALGTLAVTYWLIMLATGPQAYASARAVFGSAFVQLIMFLWTYALFYHLCNGVRHLGWDLGYGFDLERARRSAVAVFVAAGILTLITWLLAYSH